MATFTAKDWPVPPITTETSFFWEGIEAGEFRIQKCIRCGSLQHPPRPACRSCQSLDLGYQVATGRGTVFSYAIHYRPAMPGPERPYVSVIVDLEEGVRFLSNLVDTPHDQIEVGMAVQVALRAVTDTLTLPLFVASKQTPAP